MVQFAQTFPQLEIVVTLSRQLSWSHFVNQYKADGNWQTYTRDFLKYIQTQEASLRELVKIAQATPACLVYFEADFAACHRTYVARAARKLGGPAVTHWTAKTALPDLGYQQVA